MMKHSFYSVLLTGCLLLAVGGLSAAEDPILKMFPMNVTFHASFDDGTAEADMASGSEVPVTKEKELAGLVYGEGVFGGKSLLTGLVSFSADQNVDFTLPGTIICWIAPVGWTNEVNKQGKGNGYTVFFANAAEYQFIMGKMNGQPSYARHMNFYFYFPPRTAHSCTLFDTAAFAYPGEWKMVACTWNANTFSTVVNNKIATAKKPLIKNNIKTFRIGSSGKPNPEFPLMVDQVTILDRELTIDELKTYFNECKKLIKVPPEAQDQKKK